MRELRVMSVIELRILEANAEALGISSRLLMENAGRGVADVVESKLGGVKGRRIVVFAGKGGNAGDGFVAARHLASRRAKVEVLLFYGESEIRREDTLDTLRVLKLMDSSVKLTRVRDPSSMMPVEGDVIIDALVGTGIKGRPELRLRKAIELYNMSRGLKVAIDVPSGLDPETGEAAEPTVKADVTVAIHAVKPGLLAESARSYVGEVVVVDLGIPPEASIYVGPGDVAYRFPRKPRTAHKGMGGRVLVVGGSKTYTGAPALAGMAALKAGADIVQVVAPGLSAYVIASYSPDLIVVKLEGDHLSPDHLDEILRLAHRSHSIVIGPGMGLNEDTVSLVLELIPKLLDIGKSVVVDADGLKALANSSLDLLGKAVLTPHLGEASKLLGRTIRDTLEERVKAAKEVAAKYNSVTLLKGPIDVVASSNGEVKLNRTGNEAMTVGGTGDVLSGVLAAILARGLEEFHAACIAAFVNGLAGDLAVLDHGEGLTASTMLEYVPKAISQSLSKVLKKSEHGRTP